VMAFIIGMVIKKTIGLRVDSEAEITGIDEAEHAESAYDMSAVTGRATSGLGQHAIGDRVAVPSAPSSTAVKES